MSFKIINLNSSYNVSEETRQFIISNLSFLANVWKRVNVFLVDEVLMDEIIPPQSRIYLDPNCVAEMLQHNEEQNEQHEHEGLPQDAGSELESAEDLWRRLEQCGRPNGTISFRGAYTKRIRPEQDLAIKEQMCIRIPFSDALGERNQALPGKTDTGSMMTLKNFNEFVNHLMGIGTVSKHDLNKMKAVTLQHFDILPEGEVIFICMERIAAAAKKMNTIPGFIRRDINDVMKNLIASVIIHELAHAYLRTNYTRYTTIWGRMIEESLITAYTLTLMQNDPSSVPVLIQDISNQPLEYRGYTYFNQFTQSGLRQLFDAWKHDNSQRFLKLCPTKSLLSQYGGKIGPWPAAGTDKEFDKYIDTICSSYDSYWMVLAKEILEKAIGV